MSDVVIPPFWSQHRLGRSIYQKNLMVPGGRNDLSYPGDCNSFNLIRKFRCDDDQFVFFSSIQDMSRCCASRRRQILLEDSCRDTGAFDDMHQIGGEPIADIDHGVGQPADGCPDTVGRVRVKVSLDRGPAGLSSAEFFQTQRRRSQAAGDVDSIARLRTA